ncbi:MAG: hypothetical protein LBD10_13625 [Desulfobulbus sp.]|jgi:hypothetical protein|uniref:hypothetical protein n=1 Tax=Desulfobulbus sp. TaxID=895 RepID=UPI002848B7CD|nr:hypothetical protein [Desulfobulbus sp.]MDR2551229.1 hypothetical protein [Desulfobulbus sp.]
MLTADSPAGARKDRRSSARLIRRIPLLLLLVFLLLLLTGIAVDEPARVLEQARSVCLPCIGID